MSERRVKAVAGALGPKALDLTQYRQRSSRDSTMKLKAEHAAGALAFSARENALGAALLRLKYADQRNKQAFMVALTLLLKRHGFWKAAAPSIAMHACASMALFEWVADQCPKCRKGRKRAGRPGMRCVSCSNSGRITFRLKQRFALVNQHLAGVGAAPLKLVTYQKNWDRVYLRFLADLRDVDRLGGSAIDLGWKRQENRATISEPRELVAEPADDEPTPSGAGLAPEEPSGKLFPKKP